MNAPRIGVVLSSGGGRGVYGHTGFLKALDALGIEVAAGAGCSAGAVVGAVHASGGDLAAWSAAIARAGPSDFWAPDPWPRLLWSLAARRGRGWTGLSDTAPARAFVARHLGADTFEACRYPFRCVALSLGTGRQVTFESGTLGPRVMASAAMPLLYRPVPVDRDLYCDGALITLAPTEAICCRLGLDALVVHHVSLRQSAYPDLATVLAGPWSVLGILHRVLYRQSPWYLGERPVNHARCPCGCGAPVVVVELDLPELAWPLTDTGPAIERAAEAQAAAALAPLAEALRTDPRARLGA